MTDKQHEAAADAVLDDSPKRKNRSTRREPVTATLNGERYLMYRDVALIVSAHPLTIRRWVDEGNFPEPVRLGENRVGFKETEVNAWMETRERSKPQPRNRKPRLGSSPLRAIAGRV
jgi:predicted DNA-binding transcriptional regulator AlpA